MWYVTWSCRWCQFVSYKKMPVLLWKVLFIVQIHRGKKAFILVTREWIPYWIFHCFPPHVCLYTATMLDLACMYYTVCTHSISHYCVCEWEHSSSSRTPQLDHHPSNLLGVLPWWPNEALLATAYSPLTSVRNPEGNPPSHFFSACWLCCFGAFCRLGSPGLFRKFQHSCWISNQPNKS